MCVCVTTAAINDAKPTNAEWAIVNQSCRLFPLVETQRSPPVVIFRVSAILAVFYQRLSYPNIRFIHFYFHFSTPGKRDSRALSSTRPDTSVCWGKVDIEEGSHKVT